MPLILKNKTDRIAFQFGNRSALRATNEVVEQLQAQLKFERAKLAEKQHELTGALKDLAEARHQLAQRDTLDAFANAPSPSTSLH